MPGKISVLLVEDHRLMFEGISSLLTEYSDVNLLGVATTVADAVAKASLLKPDVVLMDYRLPDGDGAQASERIRKLLPDTAVLFLSADPSESALTKAVEAGAAGFISKAATAEELIGGIRKAADGEFLLETATMARLIEQRSRQPQQSTGAKQAAPELTAREREVLALIAMGRDNLEIAHKLDIGQGAVRGHVRSILEKLGVHSRVQAVADARRAGLVEA